MRARQLTFLRENPCPGATPSLAAPCAPYPSMPWARVGMPGVPTRAKPSHTTPTRAIPTSRHKPNPPRHAHTPTPRHAPRTKLVTAVP